jgi:pimeloyl-ACP methyl ester carboxylesterase
MLSGQNLSKSGALCPDINSLLPSGFLTYIRGPNLGRAALFELRGHSAAQIIHFRNRHSIRTIDQTHLAKIHAALVQMSYSRPANLPTWKSINPRPFPGTFSSVSEPCILPQLPSPIREPTFAENYTLTTHVVPAAYPRVSPDIPVVQVLPTTWPSSEEESRRILSRTADEVIARLEKHANGRLDSRDRKIYWNCVNRYVKKDLRDASDNKRLTLFFAHASGFPKEIWEPTLRHLLFSRVGPQIDEIWSWEAIQHGDAALLNADTLSGIFDWTDGTRDILNFLLNYLPSAVIPHELPSHLPRVSTEEFERRQTDGFQYRTFVAVGHSFGGCTSASAAIQCPVLFSSLILVDPVIVQPFCHTSVKDFVVGAFKRTERWDSREAALKHMSKSPLSTVWDPDVLSAFVEHALTPDPRGGMRLKCSPVQEGLVYADARVAYEVWELIEHLDERVELRWVSPGKTSKSGIQSDEATKVRVWRRPQNSSNSRILSAGHLIPHEAPRELAEDLCNFLLQKYGSPPWSKL